jgi:hypothetical protein
MCTIKQTERNVSHTHAQLIDHSKHTDAKKKTTHRREEKKTTQKTHSYRAATLATPFPRPPSLSSPPPLSSRRGELDLAAALSPSVVERKHVVRAHCDAIHPIHDVFVCVSVCGCACGFVNVCV